MLFLKQSGNVIIYIIQFKQLKQIKSEGSTEAQENSESNLFILLLIAIQLASVLFHKLIIFQ